MVDRVEDMTDPELIDKNKKCDRSVGLYGWVRGEGNEMIEGAVRWKRNIANKAKESFIQRQLNAKNLHSVSNVLE